MKFLVQKDAKMDKDGVQFICNKNIINIKTRIGELPLNTYGFVDLYYVKMETFG